ncbi:MAG: N-acetylglucosamine kinase [Ignavibacteriales bacterium]
MKYLIGMDGGGTKTACVVTDLDGNKLFECTGGPSNFLMIGTDTVSEMLFNLISRCKDELNAEYSDFISIVLGTTGAGRRPDAQKLEDAFNEYSQKKGVCFQSFYVDSDARIALEGAFSGNPGSILIAGTGSIMFGKDEKGIVHRVGGFGRFLGDQGSGYVIGRMGLTMVTKEMDGRGEKTVLTQMIAEKFNLISPEVLISEVYKNNFDIATVAPLVIEAAEKGDEVCQSIVEEESYELILHIHAMLKKINEPVLNLSLIGGIISSENYFAFRFREQVTKNLPNVNIKQPDLPPAMGAIVLAKQQVKK